MRHRELVSLSLLGALIALSTLWAQELPDSRVNPATSEIESVQAVDNGGDLDIRHVLDPGAGEPTTATWLTTTSTDDRRPRIEIDGDGNTWVAWWRDDTSDTVRARRHDHTAGTWGSELTVNESGQSARHPTLLAHGADVWIAYELDASAGTTIIAGSIIDDPDPVGIRHEVRTTSWSGDRDVRLHSSSGTLWITWVDDSSYVGYSEWDAASSTWSAAAFESYASDSVVEARKRVEFTVLGG